MKENKLADMSMSFSVQIINLVKDPRPLQEYMDKWDGQPFIDALRLDKTKSVLEIGVGTGDIPSV